MCVYSFFPMVARGREVVLCLLHFTDMNQSIDVDFDLFLLLHN